MKKIALILIATLIQTFAWAQFSNTKMEVGTKAPELKYNDTTGKEISLAQINKGRFVLLDFWASWCGPCRRSSPALVKLYETYSKRKFKGAKKGFAVVSVSLDGDMNAWKSAIVQDKLNWPYHMSDLKRWQSEPGAIYGVGYIPQCFLIDATGTIIGKYNSIEEAEKDLIKFLK